MATKNLQINLRTPVSKFICYHSNVSPWDQITLYINRFLSSSLRRQVATLWLLSSISINEWSSSAFAFLKSCLSTVSELLHPRLRLCPRGWKWREIWAKGRVFQYSEHTRFLSNASIAWTIAGEVKPNISSPSKLPGGCRGGSLMVPSLCCLLISWLTFSRTISQHLVGDTLTNISLGQCSRYTMKSGPLDSPLIISET